MEAEKIINRVEITLKIIRWILITSFAMGGFFILWTNYGWQLPIALFMVEMSHNLEKHFNK